MARSCAIAIARGAGGMRAPIARLWCGPAECERQSPRQARSRATAITRGAGGMRAPAARLTRGPRRHRPAAQLGPLEAANVNKKWVLCRTGVGVYFCCSDLS